MDIINIRDIGGRIRALREEKKLTQLELSKELKVKRQTIAQWENGERDLKTGYIIALANYFNVSTDYILGLSEYKTTISNNIGIVTGLSEKSIEQLIYIKNTLPKGIDFINRIIQNNLLLMHWIELSNYFNPFETDLRRFLTIYMNETDILNFSKEDLTQELLECNFNLSENDIAVICEFINNYIKICEMSGDDIIEGISITSDKDFGQIIYFLESTFRDMINQFINECNNIEEAAE